MGGKPPAGGGAGARVLRFGPQPATPMTKVKKSPASTTRRQPSIVLSSPLGAAQPAKRKFSCIIEVACLAGKQTRTHALTPSPLETRPRPPPTAHHFFYTLPPPTP